MLIHEVPLHDVMVGVWCAMSAAKLIGLILLRSYTHTNAVHPLTPLFQRISE